MHDPILLVLLGAALGSAVTWAGLCAQIRRSRTVSVTLRQAGAPDQIAHVDLVDPRLFLYVRDGVIQASRELIESGDGR